MADYIMTDNGDGTYTLTPTGGDGGDPEALKKTLLSMLACFAVLLEIAAAIGMVYVFVTEFIMKMGATEGLIQGIPLIVAFITLILVNVVIFASLSKVSYGTEDGGSSIGTGAKILAMVSFAIDRFSDFFVYFVYVGAVCMIALGIITPEAEWYYLALYAFTGLSSYFYLLRVVDYGLFIKRHDLPQKNWLDIILSIVVAPFGLLAAMIVSLVVQLPFYFMNLPFYAAGGYFDLATSDATIVIILVFMIGYFDLRKRLIRKKL